MFKETSCLFKTTSLKLGFTKHAMSRYAFDKKVCYKYDILNLSCT